MNLSDIWLDFKWKFLFTLSLILVEAGLAILFPLFIGYAIDGAIQEQNTGAIQLGILGLASLIIGGGRRFFDSRFYAQIFKKYGAKVVSNLNNHQASIKTARLGMLREMVAFLENSLPEIINALIGLIGVMIIIATLNTHVFFGSLIATLLIFMVFKLTSNYTIRLNTAFNDTIEQQVDVIASNNNQQLDRHLKNLMKWNIKLSDLEMMNFSISWLFLMAFLVLSIIISAVAGIVKYGTLFALIMYVFQYIESVISLPLFYQNWLRLKEIKDRLKQI